MGTWQSPHNIAHSFMELSTEFIALLVLDSRNDWHYLGHSESVPSVVGEFYVSRQNETPFFFFLLLSRIGEIADNLILKNDTARQPLTIDPFPSQIWDNCRELHGVLHYALSGTSFFFLRQNA
jgi:hypothetical protein